MAAPKKVDYDRIEPSWRAGIKSPAQMAAEYTQATGVSVSHVAITKHFKKLGVPRDLSAKVHAKADAMVIGAMVAGKVATATKVHEAEIVNEAATQVASIRLSHRADIRRANSLVLTMLAELESVTGPQTDLDELRALIEQADPDASDAMKLAVSKVVTLPSRIGSMKSLADALKTLVGLEREAWDLATAADGKPTETSNIDELNDQQLAAIARAGRPASLEPPAGSG